MMEIQSFSGNERFEILSVLGKGGMSVVYEAYDRELGRKVALKTVNTLSSEAIFRLKTEFRALQELDHPNLVSLGELFEDRGRYFFTMELVQGMDIISYVRGVDFPASDPQKARKERPGRLSFDEERLRHAFLQLADALDAIHASSRVHRDIKPSNILVQPDGRLILLDFGLVTPSEPGLESVDHFQPVGTVAYMAPEQAASLEIGPKADWYSFGVLLFEALTGRLPFSGTYNQVLLAKRYEIPPNPRDAAPGIPESLADLTVALLSYNVAARPGVDEVRRVLARQQHTVVFSASSVETRGPIFIGRDRELETLVNAAHAVRQNGFTAFLVQGASGLGKSELLKMAGRIVLSDIPGAIVLWGRCNERETVSFKAFDGVVDALSRNLLRLSERELGRLTPANVDLLTRVFPVLACLSDPRFTPTHRTVQEYDPQEVRSLAFAALREHLALLSELHTVVLMIDDIQWADQDSVQLLRALTQPPDPPPLLLVLSMRTNPDADDDASRAWIRQLPFSPEKIELGPLPFESSLQLAQTLLETCSAAPDVRLPRPEAIVAEAAGHPLFIQELVQHVSASGVLGSGQAASRSPSEKTPGGKAPHAIVRLDDVLWERVVRLEPALRQLVELTCVSFASLRQDTAAYVLGVAPAEIFRRAVRLKALHLLRTTGPGAEDCVEPYHDRVREAVNARLDEAARMQWHRALLRVLRASRHVEPELLAEHMAAVGENEEAAKLFVSAADRAAEKLAFDRAAGLYERAIQLMEETSADEALVRSLTLKLGEALVNAGRGRDAARTLLKAVEGARAAEVLDIKRRAAEQLMYSGFIDEGLRVLDEILRVIGVRVPRTALGRLAGILWNRFVLRFRGLSYKKRDETMIPPVELVHADILRSLTMGVGGANVLLASYSCVRMLLQSLKIGELGRIFFAICMEANLVSANTPESSYLRRLMMEAERIQAEWKGPRLPYLETARSFAYFMQGLWAESRKHTQSALRIIDEHGGMFWERSMMNNQYIWELFYLGEIAAMDRHIQLVLRDARNRGDLFSASGMVLGLGNFVILNREGPQRASQVIDDVLQQWSVDGYHLQHYWALLSRANIDIFLGNPMAGLERVQKDWNRIRNHLLMLIPAIRNEARFLHGRTALSAAAQEKGARRRELLKKVEDDARRLSREKLKWTQATSLLLSAGVHAWMHREEAAVIALKQAIAVLDACSMGLYGAAARIRLGRLLGGDEGKRLQEEGFAFMKTQGIRNEPAILEVLAPGF